MIRRQVHALRRTVVRRHVRAAHRVAAPECSEVLAAGRPRAQVRFECRGLVRIEVVPRQPACLEGAGFGIQMVSPAAVAAVEHPLGAADRLLERRNAGGVNAGIAQRVEPVTRVVARHDGNNAYIVEP